MCTHRFPQIYYEMNKEDKKKYMIYKRSHIRYTTEK